MVSLRRVCLCLCHAALLTAGGTVDAQPVTVFELDDYLDPRILGSKPTDEGSFEAGPGFLLVESVMGVVGDFEYQGSFTDDRTDFLHAALRLYSGKHQLNVLVTGFEAEVARRPASADGASVQRERARAVPDHRIRFQYGRYAVNSASRDGFAFVSRNLWSVGYEDGPEGTIYELGWKVDFPLDDVVRRPGQSEIIGSFAYDWRIVEGGYDLHRLLYNYDWKNRHWRNGATPVRFTWGGERSEGHWRWAPFRLEAGIQVPVRALDSTFYITYAPSYRIASRGFDEGWNHELAVFLNPVVVGRVFKPRTR